MNKREAKKRVCSIASSLILSEMAYGVFDTMIANELEMEELPMADIKRIEAGAIELAIELEKRGI